MNGAIQNDGRGLIEVRSGGLHREEHGREIPSEDLFERAERGLADRRQRGDTGVRKYDVKLAEPLYGSCNGPFGRFDTLASAWMASSPFPRSEAAASRLFWFRRVIAARALRHKKPCGGQANARALGHSRAEKAETHKRIVEIASKRFREDGLARVGIAELMKEGGLTVGGFYKHFDSRDDLVAEAVSSAFGYWKRQLDAAAQIGRAGVILRKTD